MDTIEDKSVDDLIALLAEDPDGAQYLRDKRDAFVGQYILLGRTKIHGRKTVPLVLITVQNTEEKIRRAFTGWASEKNEMKAYRIR